MVVWNDTYVITADADTWPLRRGFFDLRSSGKEVLSGDLGTKRGMTAMPLSYIGMRVKTWIEVVPMGCKRHLPRTPALVIAYLQYVFGIKMLTNIRRGGCGWGMDQELSKGHVHEWKVSNNKREKIYVYLRKMKYKRWVDCYDRLDWMELHNLIFHEFTYTFSCWCTSVQA